jgi:hypothetical protein
VYNTAILTVVHSVATRAVTGYLGTDTAGTEQTGTEYEYFYVLVMRHNYSLNQLKVGTAQLITITDVVD